MKPFLTRPRSAITLAMLAGLVLSLDIGCGRAVLGDDTTSSNSGGPTTNGSGGSGATGGNSSNGGGPLITGNGGASTVSTSSTGVTCNCQIFCAALDPCGFGSPTCVASCENGEVPDDIVTCGCQAQNCDELVACANGGPGQSSVQTATVSSVGPSSSVATSSGSGSSGAGGGVSQACGDCANNVATTQCNMEVAACFNNAGCQNILDCMGNCGWGDACEAVCVNGPPPVVASFYNLMACAVCTSCMPVCINDPVGEICF